MGSLSGVGEGEKLQLCSSRPVSHQKPARGIKKEKKKKALSQLLFLQLGSDQLPKCVPGASLSLNCLFYRSTDHIWKSLGRQGSPVASAPR